jgi:peptide deformylase
MILSIYGYGQSVLKVKSTSLEKDYPGLTVLIQNMWETMYHANGVGLAAPQIGLGIRLFVIDTQQMFKDEKKESGIKKVFINAEIIEESGDPWSYEEGCLSIPEVRGEVERCETLVIRYFDEQFKEHIETFGGINARVIQHEYDHIEGILFIDRLSPRKKTLIRRKLELVIKGKVLPDYKIKWAAK